jgi:hypothetical protein
MHGIHQTKARKRSVYSFPSIICRALLKPKQQQQLPFLLFSFLIKDFLLSLKARAKQCLILEMEAQASRRIKAAGRDLSRKEKSQEVCGSNSIKRCLPLPLLPGDYLGFPAPQTALTSPSSSSPSLWRI